MSDFQKMMLKGDIEGLTKALKSKDPDIRYGAILGLCILAIGKFAYNFPMRAREIRKKACWALANAVLEPPDVRVMIKAMEVLVDLYKSGELPSELRKPVEALARSRLFGRASKKKKQK